MIYEEVENALNKLLKLKNKPDAVFAATDKLTTNCMRYCKIKKVPHSSEACCNWI
jgi:LacI family transcriptional regulator